MGRIFADTKYVVTGEADGLTPFLNGEAQVDSTPQLVLTDIGAFEDAITERVSALRAAMPSARIVVLANRQDAHLLLECFGAGVDGCVLKDISSAALVESLDLVLLGERVFPSQLLSMLMRDNMPMKDGKPSGALSDARLSDREMQILRCLVVGSSNKVIANRLNVTEATVKVHLKSILRKIKAQNRTQAAIWALNQGLADDPTLQSEGPARH
jgi:two-component system nitrate/nitrite response regulator NarL